ncbi:Cyclic di-GMP phosphodiesterase Gmr [Sphingomonas antarctica]|uniref:putative bifunctional diguanylate cyclase/phosphodiesterase n=1 Tax=Sphingomonas antarctica TaxID=2040274 RepID=UPI0039E74301
MQEKSASARPGAHRELNSRKDVLTGGIVFAALILFVSTGSRALSSVVNYLAGIGGGADRVLAVALVLNIALILFGWRRHRDLTQEVHERRAAEARAQLLAKRDPLTGFYNRRALAEQGEPMLATAAAQGRAVAMLLLDLDHFKNVNDVHGHAIGDALLQAAASEVVQAMPADAFIARLGGDEFACAFAFDLADTGYVETVARAVVARLAQPFALATTHVNVSVSVGIARSSGECPDMDSLMRCADIAMYAAKQQGRNRHVWFDISMERELQARNDIEAGMRLAIPRGEIVPYFEQQIDLVTGRLQGFEVLARWKHPTRGVLEPESFLPIAHDSGLIGDLSLAVMRMALREARDWDPSLTVSVNIAPVQLKDPWFAQKLVKLLTETGFPAHRLEVEITETSLFENLATAQSIAASLKNQGIRLALDDFGTGYSSLAHLRALPFDRIKIDKSFVVSIRDNAESRAIVSAITRLGDSLGLPITAEGIESREIEQALIDLGVHRGQGYFYGRPMPVDTTHSLLAGRNLLPTARAQRGYQDYARTG